jgi:single-stranded DNA-binding protein
MNSQRTPQIRLYGNLGADPEARTLKERTVTREVYDPIADDVVTRTYTDPAREIHTASLAVNAREEDGEEITRWHPLVDFQGHLASFHKGDRLEVHGFLRTRSFTSKDGEEKTVRELVVTKASIAKPRPKAA